METQQEDQIRRRAYEFWEREGRPDGRAEDFWEQALRSIVGQARSDTSERPDVAGSSSV
jgi:hypothetical protein